MEVERVTTRGVLKHTDPILKQKCLPVMEREGLDELVGEMIRAMNYPHGIGLAAPQIGELLRIVVVCLPHGHETIHYEVANPEIYFESKHTKQEWEGCLSFPDGFRALVPRHEHIKVRGFNRDGDEIQFGAKGPVARALQHEIDHLDGILIIDKATRTDQRKPKVEDAEMDIGK